MTKPRGPESAEQEREREQFLKVREETIANRETWITVRENSARVREEAMQEREETLRARAEAEAARIERERLLLQMREANGQLVFATLQAEQLADEAVAARVVAAENDRAKDEFLAILGHELRNPLAPILIALDLIAMDNPDRHEREHGIIERQVRLLVTLVDELLDASRIRSGKVALERQQMELYDVVQRAIEIARPVIEAHHQTLGVEIVRRGLAIEGDPLRLAQVVANLLTNAAKFTPAGGTITVTGERRDAKVVLRVRDSGIGISTQMLSRIFDPYVQAHDAPARPHSGLGLGLAIVRSLVAMHGGTVTAYSAGLGCGSEFAVELPATMAASGELAKGTGACPIVSVLAHRILIVDDNRDAASVTAEAMTRIGHDVRVAFDGPSALAIAEDFVPEVVVLDLALPGMDGYEVARRLVALLAERGVDLIALTGFGQAIDRERSEAAGFALHLVKPVDVATLQRAIEDAWQRSHT